MIDAEALIWCCLPDLQTWNPWDDETACARMAGYSAARRIFRIGAQVVRRERLLDPQLDGWAAVARVLRESEGGERLAAVVEAGPAALAQVLVDDDLDGLLAFEEELVGTDPQRWDSDGDCWWDGAPALRPEGAIPVPAASPPTGCPTPTAARATRRASSTARDSNRPPPTS